MCDISLDEILLKYSKQDSCMIPDNVNLIQFLSIDSIDAMRILVDIENAYGIDFNIEDINMHSFESKSKLKECIESAKRIGYSE